MTEQVRRDFVKYSFFKVNPEWRSLPVKERQDSKAQFAEVLAEFSDRVFMSSYSLVGTRGDVDFMLWKVSEEIEPINELMARVDRISDLRVDLSSHTDRSRYYIRGKSEAWTLMRSLAVPLMSELVVERAKEHEGGYADYAIKLVRSAEARPKTAMSGRRQGSKPKGKGRRRPRKPKANATADLRAVPQDLKDHRMHLHLDRQLILIF